MQVLQRELRRDELPLLATIDRSEHIDARYVFERGALQLVADDFHVAGWYPGQLPENIARLQELVDGGGIVLGTWIDAGLVALGSLDAHPVGDDPTVMKLDMLYVSAPHRHRGLGRGLVESMAGHARSRGASVLYISATPTRNTVDAYLRLGAQLAVPPDPHLLALEPEDIHLVLTL